MANTSFIRNFNAYSQWKLRLVRTVEEYRDWLEKQGLATPETQRKVREALDSLRQDRLTVVFVAEFSRGKSELINAVFFADYGRRLLPSDAGRTTMCPTEMLWDSERNEAYLRLLPIETRSQEGTIAEFKDDPRSWVHYPLNVESPEQMENTLRELIQTKEVSVGDANRLGLFHEDLHQGRDSADRMVQIPRWRHAIVSFPHPLLELGLVILDTPGLNSLGSEPELTLSTLPNAQAVVFVLAADAGVTRSDLEVWRHHMKGFHSGRQQGLAVVLNKMDVLWDDLKSQGEIDRVVAEQKASTARYLGVGEEVVFPLSAQKGLVAKVKNDSRLLARSALDQLESYLAKNMFSSRQQIILDAVENEVGQLIDNNRGVVAQQLKNIKRQLAELEELRDKSEDVIQHLLEKTREEQAQYLESVARFQAGRKELQREAQILHAMLDMKKIDRLMEKSHREMLHSWSTRGIKKTMRNLFDEMRQAMQSVTTNAERTRKMVRGVYQRFQNEFGFTTLYPHNVSTMKFRVELELLHREAEAFRRSPALAITEQSFLVKRFYKVMVVRARGIFIELNKALDDWVSHAMDLLVEQIQEHKDMMEKRLENLQKIGRSKNTLQVRIEDLEGQYAEMARQLTALRNMYNGIHISRPLDEEADSRPRLVAQRNR